jgi:hypothetical protein
MARNNPAARKMAAGDNGLVGSPHTLADAFKIATAPPTRGEIYPAITLGTRAARVMAQNRANQAITDRHSSCIPIPVEMQGLRCSISHKFEMCSQNRIRSATTASLTETIYPDQCVEPTMQ